MLILKVHCSCRKTLTESTNVTWTCRCWYHEVRVTQVGTWWIVMTEVVFDVGYIRLLRLHRKFRGLQF